jgi:hypothetical protein
VLDSDTGVRDHATPAAITAAVATGEPTAALTACHQCAFWDSVSLP